MLPDQEFTSADTFYAREAAKAGMLLPPERRAEIVPRLWWSRQDVPFYLPTEVASGPPAMVEANHGRWIVTCPDPECGSAQLAARLDPRFFCASCLNERTASGAAWLPVVWPEDADAVEAVLRERDTVNANAVPGETVADLVSENVAAGLPVPDEVM